MLRKTQDQLLVGAILGDSHVERNGSNCRVRFEHATRQREYVYWKHKMLSPHAGKVTETQVTDKRTKKTYCKTWCFLRCKKQKHPDPGLF